MSAAKWWGPRVNRGCSGGGHPHYAQVNYSSAVCTGGQSGGGGLGFRLARRVP